ncbi:WG repeat-containing protein [Paenibacillus sp. YPG26]|uniref:WG repeat-containing protein n=1 Tax=Paenibacillus sp. YPG26 TaxID=2878915 RepID=UPI00203F108C|nr:WG repeat-containing protein [Paenibacillus sp. YPG26]USB34085.1 WG repeat-containing protein [Paenibacillus sp. YPG26]
MKFTNVAGEYFHFLALDTNGDVWGWGNNLSGQLGDSSISYHTVPVRIHGFENVKLIDAGYDHSTVVKQDGTVWVMGSGQDDSQPRQMSGISDVIDIADSAYYTLALRKDGTVWGWGRNKVGQLGNGQSGDDEALPVQVQSLSNVTAISASFDESLAVTSDGNVWRWGGVIKCSGRTCKKEIVNSPVQFKGLSNVKSLSSDIALLQDGTVVKWGINYQGNIGTGETEYSYFPNPIPLPSLTDIVQVSKTRAVTKDGQVWSWGPNEYGQVGDGTTEPRPRPIKLSTINNVAEIASGEEVTVALTRDGQIYEWGNNNNGQISRDPAQIMPPTVVSMTQQVVTYALPIPWHPNDWTFAWTYLDDKGLAVKDSQIYFRVKPFSEGLAAVHRASNDLWSFITTSGEPAFPGSYRVIRDFHQGRAAVKDDKGWQFINTKGEYISQARYPNVNDFASGLAPVLVGKKWGYINLSGQMSITPQFSLAQPFVNSLAAVQMNGKWGYIDSKGKMVIKAIYSSAGSFTGSAAAVKQNGKWGYISKTGAWLIKPQYEDAKGFSTTPLAPVKIKGKWGYINLQGKPIISPQYDDAAPFQEGLASVKKNGLWAIIDSKGNKLTSFEFVEVRPYNNKLAWAVTKTDNGYIDAAGKWYYKAKIVKLP